MTENYGFSGKYFQLTPVFPLLFYCAEQWSLAHTPPEAEIPADWKEIQM